MITYLYWFGTFAICLLALFGSFYLQQPKTGLLVAFGLALVSFAAYYFHFQQIFVKHYGGVMSLTVPAGQHHLGATWKDDNLWIENYEPATNTCHFTEYSKGNLLQGRVVIKNCNPLMPAQ